MPAEQNLLGGGGRRSWRTDAILQHRRVGRRRNYFGDRRQNIAYRLVGGLHRLEEVPVYLLPV